MKLALSWFELFVPQVVTVSYLQTFSVILFAFPADQKWPTVESTHRIRVQGDGDVSIKGITFSSDGSHFIVNCRLTISLTSIIADLTLC